ncbi:MAG TPA: glutaconate CoA-transferase, partial [Myxococcaceae bacterium]|nr:glutaconate CoA-transferase [Myxococcaceae bacterium]
PSRRTPLITDLGVFELCAGGATLLARHATASVETIRQKTGFAFEAARPLPVTSEPSPEHLKAIQSIDPERIRDQLVG